LKALKYITKIIEENVVNVTYKNAMKIIIKKDSWDSIKTELRKL